MKAEVDCLAQIEETKNKDLELALNQFLDGSMTLVWSPTFQEDLDLFVTKIFFPKSNPQQTQTQKKKTQTPKKKKKQSFKQPIGKEAEETFSEAEAEDPNSSPPSSPEVIILDRNKNKKRRQIN
jgi:hypothetical protein